MFITETDASLTIEVASDDAGGSIWVELRGVADIMNHHHLHALLARVPISTSGVVHVRLSRLQFCDVRALGCLHAFVCRARGGGLRVVTHGASVTVSKMILAFGWERDFNPV